MTRVLIVVGIRLYGEGLAALLGAQDGFAVVGTESNSRTAAAQVEPLKPDVALVEMGIPELDALITALGALPSPIPVVAIGLAGTDSEILGWLEKGACGYVTREASVEELTGAIHRAANGELICSPRTAGALVRRLSRLAAERPPERLSVRLTRREREVVDLMGEDLSNKEIAARLHIEVATVKNHVHNVLEKLQVHRRTEAARLLDRRPASLR